MQDRRTTTERRQAARRRSSNGLAGATYVRAVSPVARRGTDKVANQQLVQFIGARDVVAAPGCSRSFSDPLLRRALGRPEGHRGIPLLRSVKWDLYTEEG